MNFAFVAVAGNSGALAGLIIGCLVLLLIIAALVLLALRVRRNRGLLRHADVTITVAIHVLYI